MRFALCFGLLAACTDASDVPATVARIHVSAGCVDMACTLYPPEVFYAHCGPSQEPVIESNTDKVEITTNYDAAVIAGYVQLQYTSDQAPADTPMAHVEEALTESATSHVYAGYTGDVLYQLTPEGEVIELDMTKLVAASDNTLQFGYALDGISVIEDHTIEAPRTIRIETDDPGLMDACCSVGRPRELGLVVLVLGFALRSRRRR